ncbi:unnamed protein product [Schistosoma rodhaini]|uniref:Uncharacterized protein n=1 Tax=Schistosoma rodhaini TaxID=6188 RepID=A0AA85GKW1_9TREM|nr:unnamed protein product [Schistosoma rodhaini]
MSKANVGYHTTTTTATTITTTTITTTTTTSTNNNNNNNGIDNNPSTAYHIPDCSEEFSAKGYATYSRKYPFN